MRFVLLIALLFPPLASAQTPGTCSFGIDQEFMRGNEVQAALYNRGGLFFGGGTTNGGGYLVPRSQGQSPLFAMSLWVGGVVDNDARTSAARYSGHQFWPGPLNDDATLPNPSNCWAYDLIYTVSRQDIMQYEGGAPPRPDLSFWPAHLGAPVIDGDGDPTNYNLEGGDRPELLGDVNAFWVMNDVGGTRASGSSDPLGIEVRVFAFASRSTDDAFNYGTFYRYEIINRNTRPITEAYVGFFVDPDLGASGDDYVGSDPARDMAIVYNANSTDQDYGTPPALGIDLLSGAGSVISYDDQNSASSLPTTSAEYFSNLKGRWTDGSAMTQGGSGIGGSGAETTYIFPGDPVSGAFWSEVNRDGNGEQSPLGDRRFAISTPSATMDPGEKRVVDVAILFAQGTSNLNSVTMLKAASDRVQSVYDAETFFVSSEEAPGGLLKLSASPNPVVGTGVVSYRLASSSAVELAVFDVLGRQVVELVSALQPEGAHTAELDASALAPGVYVIQLRAGEEARTTRITVVR